ncbi:HesA/MoeB/ThiF family protein [Sphingobium sp. YR768]|uniref:HesA/MoeB/ThiF family protein n=1 Tax=Sphingobium sp. YR768 TaxID=1884365 RepID=UPI0008B9A934|nr:Molybdopterin or thiamine biosynthesis adenylyltransferase [Sphingobium sp. YR768]
MDRYARHNLIDWFSQDALAGMKIAVIGAGAVGNEVIKNLALLGAGHISVFDFDRIEPHNLTRSVLFREGDIGGWKVQVAAARAQELDPNIEVTAHVGDFWSLLPLRVLKTYDVVFCCVDNFEARIRCNMMCILAGVDLVNLGIDSRFSVVEAFRFSSSADSACYECSLPDSVYQRMAQRYSCGHLRKASFIERKIPTTIVTSGTAAALGVSMGLRLGSDMEVEATRVLVDTISGLSTRTSLVRNPLCPACGRLPASPPLLTCGRHMGNLDLAHDPATITVTFSEPILTGYRIGGNYVTVFKRASDFDDSYASQLADNPEVVDIEIRDQFSFAELISTFGHCPVPAKFAIVEADSRSIVFEFQGDIDV